MLDDVVPAVGAVPKICLVIEVGPLSLDDPAGGRTGRSVAIQRCGLEPGQPGSTEAVGVPDRANALTLGHRKMMSPRRHACEMGIHLLTYVSAWRSLRLALSVLLWMRL